MKLKISVITPVYNGEKFLAWAVQSVINQSYQHWELLLIDDGSTDNSMQCMTAWAKRDSRIKVLFHPGHANRGVSATRNLGIQHAQGEYVALLDCDDEWLPNKLAKQACLLEEHPDAVLVYSKAVSVDEDGVELAKSRHHFNFPQICGNGLPETRDATVTGMINDTVWMPTLTVIMKTDGVRKVGGFDETLKLQIEDHLIFTLLATAGSVYMIDEILAKYRVHKNAYTQTNQWRYSMLEYYDQLYVKLPTSYQRTITTARLKLIANKLVSIQSFRTLAGSGRALKIIAFALFDQRVSLREKTQFLFGLTRNLIKQARRLIK